MKIKSLFHSLRNTFMSLKCSWRSFNTFLIDDQTDYVENNNRPEDTVRHSVIVWQLRRRI